MSTEDIIFTIESGVATMTLNRVARHNALTVEMLRAIESAALEVEARPDARVLVLRSNSPRFFSSGADIKEWGDIDAERMGSHWIRLGNRVFRRIAELDIPSVAVLSGSALGGGLELALACDFKFAALSASVGFPEAKVGAIPGWMGCQRLTDLVGATRTRELVLLGEPITATRAAEWGVINEALPDDQLDAKVAAVCASLQSRSRVSLSVGKRLLRMSESHSAELAHEFAASVCKASPDAQEGVDAFREKRPAQFR